MNTMFKNLPTLLIAAFLTVTFNVQAGDTAYDPVSMDPPKPDPEFPPTLVELSIPSGDSMLAGLMLGANGAGPHPSALLLHGFPGNEKNIDLAQSLRRAGFNVLFFHYKGAWGSQGDYSMVNQVNDVAAVLGYLRENSDKLRVDTQKLTIIGHSLGGFSALRASAADEQIDCAIGLAAANLVEFSNASEEEKQGFAAYTDRLFVLNNYSGARAMEELDEHAEALDLRKLGPRFDGRSVLLITGDKDLAVPPAVQAGIAAAFDETPGINLTAEIIPGDHAFSGSRIRLQRMVIDWMNQNCR
jgi:pimeloyl-ACP methyl ester carboxylesterase